MKKIFYFLLILFSTSCTNLNNLGMKTSLPVYHNSTYIVTDACTKDFMKILIIDYGIHSKKLNLSKIKYSLKNLLSTDKYKSINIKNFNKTYRFYFKPLQNNHLSISFFSYKEKLYKNSKGFNLIENGLKNYPLNIAYGLSITISFQNHTSFYRGGTEIIQSYNPLGLESYELKNCKL